MQHSADLILELKISWKKAYGQDLADETANEYLNSLADFFLCTADAVKHKEKNDA